MSSDEEEKPDESPGRGMCQVNQYEDGTIQLKHTETGKTFEFACDDLDEVIGMLNTFRFMLEAEEDGDEYGEENGEL